jgi:hypothetical protein
VAERIGYGCKLSGLPSLLKRWIMRIFLAGVSCVGKTTLGAQVAGLVECRFSTSIWKSSASSGRPSSEFKAVIVRRMISASQRLKL